MRIARDFGGLESLLDGEVRDVPWAYFDAIRRAMFYLSFEELPKEERPPKRIWDNPEAMEAHFKEVERKRDEKYKNPQSDNDHQETRNDAARMLIAE